MRRDVAEKIAGSESYKRLVKTRSKFAWTLTALMLAAYFAFLFLVAFKKDFLASPIGDGVTTLSIPVGIGLIVFTIVITGIYVRRANGEFDRLTLEIKKENER